MIGYLMYSTPFSYFDYPLEQGLRQYRQFRRGRRRCSVF